MADKNLIKGTVDDDLILSATCKRNTVWLWLGLGSSIMTPIWAIEHWAWGNQPAAIPFGILSLYFLIHTLDLLFWRRIIFYRDRLVKDRSLLGQKTIYYRQAQVGGPFGGGWWCHKYYAIQEAKENGRPFFFRFQFACMPISFPLRAWQR